jgi:flagellar biosynthesis protein FlhA
MTELETTQPTHPPQAINAESVPNTDSGNQTRFNFASIIDNIKRGDVALAFGIVCILVILILPMPAWMLDIGLALSMTFSVMVLMTCLFIQKPLEFNAFPTVLLIATMLRLSLNLASTRLILSEGHEGPQAAGKVIEAFSGFVMGGNFVIGVIVFAILVIVNFIVITKGATRIAEVAARFTLDAMPGKQMAIDADLSSGIIEEREATTRRRELEDESAFFGAMDGASKFVRGDAVAGMLITFINVIGGIIIGMAQNDLPFSEATSTYTQLTVGDGLVSQIPALIVSTAAGLLVSKAGLSGSTDKALFGQLSFYPRAMALTAFLSLCLSLLPGLPILPFLAIAACTGALAWYQYRRQEAALEEAALVEQEEARSTEVVEEPISRTLAIDELRLELGYALLPLINQETEGFRLTDQIRALRRQVASDMGFVMPSVRILDNMQLGPHEYVIQVKEVVAGRGELRVDKLLAMDPRGEPIEIAGESTREPTFDLPAMWIDQAMREEASFRGLTVVDPSTVVTTHITEVIKNNMAEMLSYAATKQLLDDLPSGHLNLVEEIVPSQISITAIQRVLQRLLSERVSIRDLPTVLEGIAEAVGYTQNIVLISEHVRSRLARQICNAIADASGNIPLVTLSPEWEQSFAESIVGQGEEQQLAMAPSKLQDFITHVRNVFDDLAGQGEAPALLTSPIARPYVRSVVERFRPTTTVISQNEIHPQARIRTLSQV